PGPPPAGADEDELAGHDDQVTYAERQRDSFEEEIRMQIEHSEHYFDPVLYEIRRAQHEMREAEHRMRLLVAYGREFVTPRPYQLKELAEATGMSISGTRSAYDEDEISQVADRLGRPPRTAKREEQ
ncbi:hypothetical protein, partial [Prauserella sp. PE36]|uniref:hypothetical protein n=1 Tax=Prauserella sp. PE36 TaxID=1504709 RepID=UPI0018F54296